MQPITLIAEAGVNHNGQLDLALGLVEAAAQAGANVIKFQTFQTEKLVSRQATKAAYQQAQTNPDESQFEMLKKLELDHKSHLILAAHCQKLGITFLSTPFDAASLDFLVGVMDLPTLKIPSGEITNGPFLVQAGATRRQIILSTGLATLGEIETALGALAFGLLRQDQPPSLSAFAQAFASAQGQAELLKKITLLHCTTEYPAPVAEVNLQAMDTLRHAFGLPVGYSDHTSGIVIPIAAAARGAVVIEKHFTLDHALPGPDHQASLNPTELTALVRAIRDVEQAMGHGRKIPTASELKNRAIVRKSLIALTPIAQGERFTTENLGCKRPGTGLTPMEYWHWLGRMATQDYQPDECIQA